MKSLPRKRMPRDTFYVEKDVACATEATGLVPAFQEEPQKRRNLLALYAIHSAPHWGDKRR